MEIKIFIKKMNDMAGNKDLINMKQENMEPDLEGERKPTKAPTT